mmetsp:Transcript_20014/g.41820  ORF Transcript_20014/g.41820 Transcript_20014/m.41820 type:complete len:215 (+) Transcript_20014:1425-2069(+)
MSNNTSPTTEAMADFSNKRGRNAMDSSSSNRACPVNSKRIGDAFLLSSSSRWVQRKRHNESKLEVSFEPSTKLEMSMLIATIRDWGLRSCSAFSVSCHSSDHESDDEHMVVLSSFCGKRRHTLTISLEALREGCFCRARRACTRSKVSQMRFTSLGPFTVMHEMPPRSPFVPLPRRALRMYPSDFPVVDESSKSTSLSDVLLDDLDGNDSRQRS